MSCEQTSTEAIRSQETENENQYASVEIEGKGEEKILSLKTLATFEHQLKSNTPQKISKVPHR